MATKGGRFSGVVRAIGVISLVPCFGGFAIAGLFFISTIIATANVMPTAQSEPEQAGAGHCIRYRLVLQRLNWSEVTTRRIGWMVPYY